MGKYSWKGYGVRGEYNENQCLLLFLHDLFDGGWNIDNQFSVLCWQVFTTLDIHSKDYTNDWC